jgi:PAS domain S-box-containing protein
MLDTVAVPEQFEPIFQKAQEYVSTYFSQKKEDPSTGKIEVFGQRYILIRAASMSVDFFDTIKGMFKDWGEEKASEMARNLLFDVAHAIGKMDARNFHQRMGLKDPIEKLSAGPIHFSHTGWAFVDISAESKPTADENYYLIYDHPFSFEADAWEKSGKKSSSCVCTMNAGYSSGWCEESFGIPLVASEIMCKARGDSACRFIMAHPSKMAQYLQAYLRSHPEISDNAMLYRTGGFFQEFKQAQEALRKSEERFKQVAENAGEWIWEVNTEGLYTYSSPVVEKILGYKPEELVGKKYFYDFFAPDVKEELKKAAFEAFARGRSFKGLINPNVHKDGSTVILETNGTPVVDDKGNLCGYRGADRDITDLKNREEELKESEQRFRRIFEEVTDGILLADPETKKFYFGNKTIYQMLDYNEEEIKGLGVMDIHPQEALPYVIEQFEKQSRREIALAKDIPVKRKDGSVFYADVNSVPITLAGEAYLMGIFRDITEQKKAEQRQAELIGKVESANRELGDLVHMASHDLKTPLRGIKTLTEWLSTDYTDKFDEVGKEKIRLLLQRVDRVYDLIEGILQYSRIERAREEMVQVDLNEIIPEIIEAVAPPQNIEITIANDMPVIKCEKTRIIQVFQNLFSNAVKFIDKPQGLIKVGCVGENGLWKFNVTDNGPGIEKKYFERIFKVFQKLASHDETEGAGIGLTIVKKIVELYGGRVWVESKPGEGSTFFFTLPKEMGVKNAKIETNIACGR